MAFKHAAVDSLKRKCTNLVALVVEQAVRVAVPSGHIHKQFEAFGLLEVRRKLAAATFSYIGLYKS